MSSNTGNISSINSLRQNNDQYASPLDDPIWVDDVLVCKPRDQAFKASLEEAKKADQEAAIRQEFLDAEYNKGY